VSVLERPPAVARLLDEIAALERAYSSGHHGRWSAARRAAFVDACLLELFEASDPPTGVALGALGGYGRSRLSPQSDIDILIAHDGDDAEGLAAVADAILYPLWDAGFRVGHGVRTPAESLALATERLDARTAMLDGRLLAGDERVWAATSTEILAFVRDDADALANELRADALERLQRAGPTSSRVEPDLKQGGGGLRDIQMLGWLSTALGRSLEDAGVLQAAERAAVDAADEFLERVRSALHLETGREGDRLMLEHQPAVAEALGFVDEPGLIAADGLMRQVFEHARAVEHTWRNVFGRRSPDASAAVAVEPTPDGILRAFASRAVEHGDAVLPVTALDEIGAASVPQDIAWTAEIREAFLTILRAGGGEQALEALDRLGLLVRYLPAWAEVRCRPQRDPYHRSSVDVHLLTALAEMRSMLDGEAVPIVERFADLADAVHDPDAALLGALFHDIGKVGRGSHVREGAVIAEATLERMGVDDATRSLAAFLVSEHLLLSDTATRRDLEDEQLIEDVAARIGDVERLAALTLLTVADAAATGPHAWTPWRAALVRELVTKVGRVLERGDVGPDTAERLAERVEALRERLPDVSPEAIDRFVLRMPRSYLLGVPVEAIARHYPLLAIPIQPSDVRTVATQGDRAGISSLTVVVQDRPGLLSMIAGSLSLAGLSILSAQAYTTDDGVVVDVFDVEGTFEREIGEERWREFRSTLRRALDGRASLDARVEERRRRYASASDVPARVVVDNDASDFFTVIEVGAPDRVGLLFDITRTLATLQLDVHLAKVATYANRVIDAFYVRDALGRKLDDLARIEELRLALEQLLSPPAAASPPGAVPGSGP
jgi:[protein-PII] uridylyltransferase